MEHKTSFHKDLSDKLDTYVHLAYDCAKKFPKEELFGVTSQFRRATLSVVLNYLEGYARQRTAVFKNFVEIAYGSLKESEYLTSFAFKRNYMNKADYAELTKQANELGKMLWGIINRLNNKV
jgi:four helix bundle protein